MYLIDSMMSQQRLQTMLTLATKKFSGSTGANGQKEDAAQASPRLLAQF